MSAVRSQLDPSITLSEDPWAVTMIKRAKGNHAMLIIEGLDKDNNFILMAHLSGLRSLATKDVSDNGSKCLYSNKGRADVIDITKKKIKYGAKSETWLRSREKVELMLATVRKEKEEAEKEGENPTPFSIFGNKSIFTRDQKGYYINNPVIQALFDADSFAFDNVFKISRCPEDKIAGEISKYKVKFTLMMAASPILAVSSPLMIDPIHKRYIVVMFTLKKMSYFVDLAKKHIIEVDLTANNCFTWARGKLKMLDIEMESKALDVLVSVTSLYTKEAEKKRKSDEK